MRTCIVQSEYCEAETFRASCPLSTVIIIRRALYGRMRLGRCVLRDYGYVGCFADVVTHIDAVCSGRRACSVRIPDAVLDRANPCPKDFKTYLLVSYDCVPGRNAVGRCCCCTRSYVNHSLLLYPLAHRD